MTVSDEGYGMMVCAFVCRKSSRTYMSDCQEHILLLFALRQEAAMSQCEHRLLTR